MFIVDRLSNAVLAASILWYEEFEKEAGVVERCI
jgi:hypothetical protein